MVSSRRCLSVNAMAETARSGLPISTDRVDQGNRSLATRLCIASHVMPPRMRKHTDIQFDSKLRIADLAVMVYSKCPDVGTEVCRIVSMRLYPIPHGTRTWHGRRDGASAVVRSAIIFPNGSTSWSSPGGHRVGPGPECRLTTGMPMSHGVGPESAGATAMCANLKKRRRCDIGPRAALFWQCVTLHRKHCRGRYVPTQTTPRPGKRILEKGGTAEPFCRCWHSDAAGVVDIVEWRWNISRRDTISGSSQKAKC